MGFPEFGTACRISLSEGNHVEQLLHSGVGVVARPSAKLCGRSEDAYASRITRIFLRMRAKCAGTGAPDNSAEQFLLRQVQAGKQLG